jgi:hypothetical protein
LVLCDSELSDLADACFASVTGSVKGAWLSFWTDDWSQADSNKTALMADV